MSQEKEKVTLKRKLIIFAAMFLIFVALPGMSWYYLRSGLNWHKKANSELGNYGKIRPAFIIFPDGEKRDQLKEKVTVIHIFGDNPDISDINKKILDTGENLFNQFGKNYSFVLCMVKEGGGTAEFKTYAQTRPSSDFATWVWTGGLGGWRTIVENGYESYCLASGAKPVPEYYALADTSGMIRRFYDANDDHQIGRMVEHIAMLLPKQ
jgi:hypothetical protein